MFIYIILTKSSFYVYKDQQDIPKYSDSLKKINELQRQVDRLKNELQVGLDAYQDNKNLLHLEILDNLQ